MLGIAEILGKGVYSAEDLGKVLSAPKVTSLLILHFPAISLLIRFKKNIFVTRAVFWSKLHF